MKQRVFTALRSSLIMGAIVVASFATGQEKTSPGRKPFAGPHAAEERHSLLDAWKAARDARAGERPGVVPQATGGTAIVGRASMVINPSNSIAYTRQYLGDENNCDVNMGVPSAWRASTAYLAGDHVRRFGTNYVATSSGTSGVSGPSCGSGIGTASVDGSVNWLCEGTFWTANATYTAGMVTVPNNSFGFMYQAQNSGTTAPTEPGWPTTLGGTVVDNGVTWEAIANPQGGFRGCNPMELAVRASGGGETVIVSEGDTLPDGEQVFGWSEHIDMNSSGVVAFKTSLSGALNDDDEQGTAIVTAGPGAGTLTTVMKSGDVVASRFLCGFTSMVAINDAGQVLGLAYGSFGTEWQPSTAYGMGTTRIPASPNGLKYTAMNAGTSGSTEPAWPTNVNETVLDGTITWRMNSVSSCDTDDEALIRYTPGPGNQLLIAKGLFVAGSTVTKFGCTLCVDSYYDQADGRINQNGNVPVVLSLADGTEGVYLFDGPGSALEVARTGGSNPYTSISPRTTLNDNDQVAFIAVEGGVESLYVFTPGIVVVDALRSGPRAEGLAPPPPSTVAVVSIGDDIGTRTTATPSGVTVTDIGNYVDINNNGNVVFQVDLSNGEEGYYFWDAVTGDLQEIHRETDNDELAPEMLTLNDSDVVAYVTGSQGYDIDSSEDPQFGGAYFWQAGVNTPAIVVGDVIGGDTVTGLFGQHHSFARRQFNSTSCIAIAYAVNGDDIWMDCSAGDISCYTESPLIFTACAAGALGPTLTTVASSSVPVGGSISDTATLAGGVNPTGSITFDLYGPNDATCSGAVAFTSTVTVLGNGVYPSDPFTTSAAGTYYWIASYSGDINNSALATACNDPNESVVVTQATPAISTTATATATVGGTISDSATLASGFNPTGTVTFNLYAPGDSTCIGAPVFTSNATVTGNGTYNSASFTATSTGTYRWIASYSGDANNAATSGSCNDANEDSVVSPASPTLTTNATATAAVGTAISDSATLSGSYNATGTITFNLYDPTSPICDAAFIATSTVPVSGNGVYTSAPFTPTTPGTYRWIASYSGDANNDFAGGACNDANESSVVTKASPALTTTASAGVILGGSVSDSATLASGYNPTGSITFNLYGPGDATCSAAPVFTSTVPVAGNGNYGSASFTPASPGTYQWIATYSGDANNNIAANTCGDPNETVVVSSPSLANPTLTTVASPDVAIGGAISDTATLSGGTTPGGSIIFTAYGPDNATCSGPAAFTSTVPVTGNGNYNSGSFTPSLAGTYRFVASYSGDANNNPVATVCNDPNEDVIVSPSGPTLVTTASPGVAVGGAISDSATLSGGAAPTGTITFKLFAPGDTTCSAAPIFTSAVPVSGNGNYASNPYTAPAPGTYRWAATYSGDANNTVASSPCNAPNESVTVTPATPVLTTTASPNVALGGSVSDTATLTGGFNPGGTITFNLFGPDNATCTGAPVFTSVTNVTGNGSYASSSFTPLATGTYRWVASYSGDANNSASANACGDPSETVVITSPSGKASPTLVTTASPSVVVGGNIRDTAVLSGGNAPTGTIVFRAYGPIDTLCSGAPVFSASVPVNGNATYNSPFFRPTSAGVYNFVAIYGGDDNNNPAMSPCGAPNESVRVTPVRPTLVAAASPNVPLGSTISNTAILAGGFRPQGSILFTVFGPDNTSCTGLPLFTSSTPVDGNGTYESADFLPTETGTYSFVVEYRGDRNNQEVLVPCGASNSTVEVTCTAATAPVVSIVGEVTTGRLYPLLWTAVPDATAYEVQEATSEDFIDATTRVVAGTSADFRHDAAVPTPWFYRVRALDVCDQAFGPYSDPGRIVVVPLPPADRPDINVNIPFGTTEILVQPIFVPGVPGETFTFTAAVDQPWLSVTPESGIFTPAGVTFNVATNPALLPNGTHTGTLIVTLTTIDEAGRGVRTEGVTSVSTPVSINLVTPVTNLPSTTPQTNSILIPSLGHLQGASARWQSDIRVLNSTTSNQTYQVLFTPASEYGSGKVKTTLVTATPGQTIALDDVVRNWFGLGSLDDRTSGYLEIRPLTLTVPKAIASSRTYSLNPGSKGTLGQFIPALSFNDFIGSVSSSPSLRPPVLSMQQIAQSESFRTNVGLIEASGKPASALLSVFNTSGANLLSLPIDLGAGEQKQLNSLLAQHGIALDDGRIEVQLTSGEGKVTAFASVIDNRSGVPLLVSGVPLGVAQSTRYVLPGVADLNTASARWRTDMRVFNPDSEERSATLTFHPQNNGGAPVTREITLGPGAIRTLDDVVQSLFGQSEIGGAVHVTTPETSSLVVTGRTYNVTANGTLGQFIPAVTPAEAVGRGERTLQILQAEDSVRYRTNLGLAEVTGRPATVEVTVILPDAKITPTVRFDLQPNEFRQFRVLNDFGLANAYNARIAVRVVEGEGRVTAYGSVIDLTTESPTYIPAQ